MGHSSAIPDLMLENEMTKDWNGNDQVMLRSSRGASVKVSLHGGQVTSWRNNRGEELLFTSSKFGNCGALEQHGFARTKVWTIDENPPPLYPYNKEGKSSVDLLLKSSDEDLKSWPYSFEFRLRVSLGADGKLTLISRVRNINGKPFSFSFAYHTYLSVSDISDVRIEGLETRVKRSAVLNKGTFEAEVERVYVSSPSAIAVLDHEKKRTFLIRKCVVWNLWEKKAKSMLDFGDDEYKQMLCSD